MTDIQFHDTDRPAALHTHEGLMRYLTSKTVRPATLDAAAFAALTAQDRDTYNRERMLYLSGGMLIGTPQLQHARVAVGRLISANSGRNSGHHGIMFSGQSGLGKTTLCKALMKAVFNSYRAQFPFYAESHRVPVVYVEVPSGSTPKLLMAAFARFFGLTLARTETMDSIQHRVVSALNDANTQLVVVDEVQNLGAVNRGNGETIDVLKSLHNQVGATFIYAGMNLRELPLFDGARGQSLMARFSITQMTKFNASDPSHRKDWRGIVQQFERNLPLADHKAGTLVPWSEHLFELSRGSIGTLGTLIAGAAMDLIRDPDGRPEAITLKLLDAQELDIFATESFARSLTSKGRKAA